MAANNVIAVAINLREQMFSPEIFRILSKKNVIKQKNT